MRFLTAHGHPSVVLTDTTTTKQDNWSPTWLRHGAVIRLTGAGTNGFSGLQALPNGGVVTIVNATTDYLLWLENQNTASSAGNRFALPDGFPAFLLPGDTITVWYDLTSAVWRVVDWPNRGVQAGFSWFHDAAHEGTSVFAQATSGTGATSYASSGGRLASAVMGTAVVRTGTTAAGYGEFGGGGYAPYYPTIGPALVGVRLRLENTADGTDTWQAWIGLATTGAAAASKTDAIVWEYRWNGSAHEWGTLVMNNSVAARSTTGAPTPATGSGDYITLMVFVPASGARADFLVSTHATGHQFTRAQSVASGLPASSRLLGVLAPGVGKIAGSNTRGVMFDWAGTRISAARSA